jgi:hypothetical protein
MQPDEYEDFISNLNRGFMDDGDDQFDSTPIPDFPVADGNWAGPEPAEGYKLLWLGRSYSNQSSMSGWRIFDHKSQALRSSEHDDRKITLFNDGTWSYGIHGE